MKLRKTLLFCLKEQIYIFFEKKFHVQDMYPKVEWCISSVTLSSVNYSSNEKQIVKIQYFDFLNDDKVVLKGKLIQVKTKLSLNKPSIRLISSSNVRTLYCIPGCANV